MLYGWSGMMSWRLRARTVCIDKVLEYSGKHRLRGSEDHIADDAERKIADIRPYVAKQSKINFHTGGLSFGLVGSAHLRLDTQLLGPQF